MSIKTCKKCKIEKELSNFDKYKSRSGKPLFRATCKECRKYISKKYYRNNSKKIIENNCLYKKQHRDEINKREKNRRLNDINFNLFEKIRSAIKITIRRNKGSKNNKSSIKYLPYTIEELKQYLEGLFEPWMNWANWGRYDKKTWNDNDPTTWKWQIDHIIPKSDLPHNNMEHPNFIKCWSLSNLRPYSAKQNIIDGSSKIRHKRDI